MTDVLVVGGGSAGSILAERLSVDPRCLVTVVEAGPGLDDPAIRALTADATTLPLGPGSYRLIVTGRSYEEPGVVAHGSAVAQFSHVQLENPTVTFVTCRATPASCTRWPNCCMA